MRTVFYEFPDSKKSDIHYIAQQLFSFGLLGIIIEWIRDGFQESPNELLEILEKISNET
ncbi:TetR-like C-terminal domain-containing protein [Faecalicatena faecalis]|uniref:TetR-like C-terminal domain-containing protein n=1 Tax=Faecalicatena faecalis TaxID=2726362 RepID=UPI0038CBFD43